MPLQSPYILLVDDDDDDVEMLSSSLEAAGIKTSFYNSSDKALDFLRQVEEPSDMPLLIILDSNLPGLTGKETLALIKSDDKTKRIPVIMYSTSMPLQFQNKLLQLGAYSCYGKARTYKDFTQQVGVFKDLVTSFSLNQADRLS